MYRRIIELLRRWKPDSISKRENYVAPNVRRRAASGEWHEVRCAPARATNLILELEANLFRTGLADFCALLLREVIQRLHSLALDSARRG